MDEQIYFINDQAEKDLEVQIIFKPIASNGIDLTDYKSRFHNEILDDVLSGQHKYDISANMACYTASPAIRNYAANLLDTERFPYFNFEPGTTPDGGWYSSLIEDTAINGKLYYLSGIMNTSLIDATPVVWYNHTLYRKLREESDPESLQETVLAGDWTYDELYKWTSASHDDFDGLGLIVNKNNTAPLGSVPYACDIDFVVKNPGGGHSFYIKENERITQAFEKLNAILDCDNTSTDATVTSFAEGRALFYMDVIFRNCEENSLIREMEYSYGLLPLPKYDKSQTHYFSTPDDFYTLMLVPDHKFGDNATDGALVSAFLQHRNYNAVSTAQIAGYHFNQTIKPRYFGVYEYPTCSSLSLTIQIWDEHILPGIRLDFASVYSPQLNYLSYLWTEAIERREYPAQVFEDYKNIFDIALKDTDEWLNS